MNRKITKKRRNRNKILGVLLFVVTLLVLISFYIFYQYYQGLSNTRKTETITNKEEVEFNGAEVENKLGKVNVLLLGVDSRGEEKSRTDTIMIAQYDPKENRAKLVSLMRDIYVDIPNHNSYKLNTAYFLGGPELLRKTIKENFDVDIHYYALIDFKGFEEVIDTLAPNGIEINVEKQMSEYIDVVLEPGLQKLNGMELLQYARFRHDAEGDFGRVQRQQKVISELKDQLFSITGVTKIPKLVGTAQPYVETNLTRKEITGLLADVLLHSPETIETLRIPIDHSFVDATYDHAGAVLEIDMEKNAEALDEFLNKPVDIVAEDGMIDEASNKESTTE
ncbi:LCP family protein [Bacillus sp. 1P02SD]|uniref:LCP family protein n=1 Tax=Bacillus sp. 1P02SD TaxID=3132264 RepID=UPI00399F14A3